VDIGTVIAYKRGDRPMGAIRTKEKNHGIEESDEETQEGQENAADEAPYPPVPGGSRPVTVYNALR
jgi:hypothetical protein